MRDLTRDPSQFLVNDVSQMFLDNLLIYSFQNVARRWHQPGRVGDGPVIQKDRPWEHITYFTYSNYCVLRDERDGLFKCWYEDLIRIDELQGAGRIHCYEARQLYAESEDGMRWNKPELELVEEDGLKTNIVLGNGAGGLDDVHSMGVVIDPYPPSPDYRFRALFTHRDPHRANEAVGSKTIAAAHSPDGIHWQPDPEAPVFGMAGPQLGDVCILAYDPDAREFVLLTRHYLIVGGAAGAPQGGLHHFASKRDRRVWQARSYDLIHWSEPILVAAADEDDALDEEFYGMCQYRQGALHLATVGVYQHVENEREVQLLLSRDGIRWKRTNKRRPFLSPRGPGHYDAHMVALTSPPIEVGDELWFYNGGSECHHDWWLWGRREGMDHPEVTDPSLARFSMGLVALRKDGYAGLYASKYREGLVVTQSVISEGTQLEINAKCNPGGSIRVAVTDASDSVLGPCTKENCDAFTGGSVAHTVTWQGDASVPSEKWRRLRFSIVDAELFSFRFVHAEGQAGGVMEEAPTI